MAESEDLMAVVTLLSALHQKYADDDEDSPRFCHIVVPKSAPGRKDSGAIIVPRQLSLNDYHITSMGNLDNVAESCAHVTELDLTKNDIDDINQVIHAVDRLPCLTFLNLCTNPLTAPVDQDQNFQPNTRLKTLVLNKTGLTMETLQQILDIFIGLQELHLSMNGYEKVTLDTNRKYKTLRTLTFNDNKVTEWIEFCRLGQVFSNLETLIMTENNLEVFDSEERTRKAFSHLKCLNISKTGLKCWDEIDKLNDWLPSLVDIRLMGIPLLEAYSEAERRDFLLARLPKIQLLNGGRIQEEHRFDAERAFIRYYMDCEEKPDRYVQLESKHGKLDPLVNVNLDPDLFPLVKVSYNDKVKTMRVNTKQTVSQLKAELAKYAGRPANKIRLIYYRHQYAPDEMRYPKKILYSYNIQDGDAFEIWDK